MDRDPQSALQSKTSARGRLADLVAVVTGAGSVGAGWGNGKATAVSFAREGATVRLIDRNKETLAEATEGGDCTSFAANVSIPEQCVAREIGEAGVYGLAPMYQASCWSSCSGPSWKSARARPDDGNEPELRPRPMLSSFNTASIRASQADAFSW